jgi:N utilization substance protein B
MPTISRERCRVDEERSVSRESDPPPAGVPPEAPKKRGPPKSARRRSREFALQGLYEWLLSGDAGNENAGAVDAHIRETPGFDKADAAHYADLLHGSIRDVASLRVAITPHLDRPIQELSPVEHAVLLIGAYELVHHVEIPYRVVINEAVEVAKSFGGTDGFKYVNGVLDKVGADLRPSESRARQTSR